ncbi:MAG: LamG domain-containing protein, partial [Phycisphaerae bacterium]|nr:LamG domain-containing protein [Phycisphaerae bacterium]
MNTRSTIVRCGTLVLATLFCTSLAIAGTPADAAGGRAGLIAYWSFDENDGDTAHDSSGYGNHGTIYNASWADGISGSALEFGGGDYVSVPISTSTTFTVTAWMRPYTDASSQIQMILDKPGNFNIEYRSSGAEGNRISQYTYQGDLLFSNTNLDVDAWSFIVLVRTPSVASFYLNGAYDGGGATSPRSVSGTCTIGSRSGASYQFEGIIDEMRIYDGALSAEEVLDLYEQYWSDCNSNGIPDDEEIAAGQGAGFEDASSWATYDAGAHGVGTDPDGYQGSVFDGRYAYFVPMHNGSERHGEVLRYDTDGDFSDVSSWAAFDAGANGVGTDPDGYASGAFDGRYVYFPPENNGSSIHGEALRYDTTGNFSTASSWSTYDAGANGVGSDSDGYSDAVFDGRYIYFVPYHNGSSYNGEVLRYDTEGSFSAALSWAVYAPGSHGVGNNPTGYQGGVFDGRYIYFVPCRNSSGYNGEV